MSVLARPNNGTVVPYCPDLRAIIESLIPSFIAHNHDEIASTLSLKGFRDPQMPKHFQDWSDMKAREVTTTMFFITNHNLGYEGGGGRTKDVLPIPWVIRWICGKVGWWPYVFLEEESMKRASGERESSCSLNSIRYP